jgi:hypothetical protein
MDTENRKWSVDGYDLTSIIEEQNDGYSWKHVCRCDYGYAEPEKHFDLNKKNAKIIAASLDMLNALIEISEGKGSYDPDKTQHYLNCLNEMVEIAKKVIKKATE